jgi:hypothetical protein
LHYIVWYVCYNILHTDYRGTHTCCTLYLKIYLYRYLKSYTHLHIFNSYKVFVRKSLGNPCGGGKLIFKDILFLLSLKIMISQHEYQTSSSNVSSASVGWLPLSCKHIRKLLSARVAKICSQVMTCSSKCMCSPSVVRNAAWDMWKAELPQSHCLGS